MPRRPLSPCPEPGCSALTGGGRCARHRRVQQAALEQDRASSHERGYTRAWQRARGAYLREHPLCECAEHVGRDDAPAATVVDHIRPHRGDRELFWDRDNWRAMAKPCHDRKTARQDGGFGRRRPA